MAIQLIHRLFHAFAVMFGVCTVVFLLLHLIPGDPVALLLGEQAHVVDYVQLRQQLGLDQPLSSQYWHYLSGLAHLDFGRSFQDGQPVAALLSARFPATLQLTIAALGVAISLAIPLGLIAAYYHGRWPDWSAMTVSLAAAAVPNFWLGPLLILMFSLWLGWTPVSGRESAASLILPAVTLGTSLAAVLARLVRSSVLETLNEDYIRTARAKGLTEYSVLWHHALRNAWLPILTIIGLQLGGLLSGAVITETIFAWPGLGSLLVDAIKARDYPVVQGTVLIIGLCYVIVNTVTDLLYLWADPRIRF
jgi:peptide/nickel transport system permease protein